MYMLCFVVVAILFPLDIYCLCFRTFDKIKCLLSVSRVFSHQQLNNPQKLSKQTLNKIVIRGTKDRPPQGSLKRVVRPV